MGEGSRFDVFTEGNLTHPRGCILEKRRLRNEALAFRVIPTFSAKE